MPLPLPTFLRNNKRGGVWTLDADCAQVCARLTAHLSSQMNEKCEKSGEMKYPPARLMLRIN
jgi:hypothetical protein